MCTWMCASSCFVSFWNTKYNTPKCFWLAATQLIFKIPDMHHGGAFTQHNIPIISQSAQQHLLARLAPLHYPLLYMMVSLIVVRLVLPSSSFSDVPTSFRIMASD
jgi:hypothetical protein